MTPPRWRQIEAVFATAVELGPARREAYLAAACAGDEDLRREIEGLLACDQREDNLLEPPARETDVPAPSAGAGEPPSQLACGQRLGPYSIGALLGAGGMGEVYSAIDTRLDRTVALKLLPRHLTDDPQALKRFRREAHAVSALNHPNICILYDVGEFEGQPFLVMELLEGGSLKERLAAGPLPVPELLALAVQIAAGLEAAHAKGIVHRDIKPANVIITPRSEAKILDFGLAKLISEPTAQRAGAAPGAALPLAEGTVSTPGWTPGTVAYMSPEQVRGEPVDAATDLFSLGVTLYEMAIGTRPFQGETPAAVTEAILGAPPKRPRTLNRAVPRQLERIILKALEKERTARYQTATELQTALERLRGNRRSVRMRAALSTAGAAALAIAGFAIAWQGARSAVQPPPIITQLTTDTGLTYQPAISPDGRLVAYASDRAGAKLDIWVQPVPRGAPLRLTRDAGNNWEPSFSPDGRSIAFVSDRNGGSFAGGGIYAIPTAGGEARKIAKMGHRPRFSPDGKWIAYWTGSLNSVGLTYVVPSAGGVPRTVLPEIQTRSPVWTPDGRHLVCSTWFNWWVAPVDGGPPIDTGVTAKLREAKLTGSEFQSFVYPEAWIPGTREVLFSARSGDSFNLWTASLSPRTWKIERLRRLTAGAGPEVQPSCASAARLVFSNMTRDMDVWTLPVDANRGRAVGSLRQVTHGSADDEAPSVSADGKRIVFGSDRTGIYQVWTTDPETGRERVLITKPAFGRPVISPDGEYVAFNDPALFVYVVPFAGGMPQKVGRCQVSDWMPGSRSIVCQPCGPSLARLDLLEVGTGRTSILLAHTRLNIWAARVAPGGEWVSFGTERDQQRGSFIAPLVAGIAAPESAWIRADGRYWSPDGKRLWRFDGNRIFSQCLDARSKLSVGGSELVYEMSGAACSFTAAGNPNRIGFSVARDRLVFAMGRLSGNIWMAEWRK